MKILYDHQIFTYQKYGGISRYFYELIRCLTKKEDIDIATSVFFSNNHYISDKIYVKHIKFFLKKDFKGKHRLVCPINKILSILNLKKQDFDIFHPTYYDPYFLSSINKKPFVLTVYDMTHEKFDDLFSLSDNTTNNKRILVQKASKVIAISENTKNDLIDIFGVEESKIEVVYLGNSMTIDDEVELNIDLPEKYILFVGSRNGYKNFVKFIKSISILFKNNIDISVVCVGGGDFSIQEESLFVKSNIKDRIFQFDLTDEALSYFYKKALIFVFPSLYEGFGIPILEAFACKCPLVCSNTSSLPEIAQNGAEYFDPNCEKSIYNAMKNVIDNQEIRDKLIKNGTERLKDFSWKQSVDKTKKIYEDIFYKEVNK